MRYIVEEGREEEEEASVYLDTNTERENLIYRAGRGGTAHR